MYCEVRHLSTKPRCDGRVEKVIITLVTADLTDAAFTNRKRAKWQNACIPCSQTAALIPGLQVVLSNPNPPWIGNPLWELLGAR